MFQSFIDLIWPERINSLSPEESMKLVRQEYKQRNRDTESWMTRHDRDYLKWQKMYRADSTRIWRLDGNNNN